MPVAQAPAPDAEGLLWQALAERLPQAGFRRNEQIGLFAVDFLSPGAKLIVEVDGPRVAETAPRSAFARSLELAGHRVLHFWDDEVTGDLDAVLGRIADSLDPPSPEA